MKNISVRIISADIPQVLKQLTDHGVRLYRLVNISELVVQFCIQEKDRPCLCRVLNKRGDRYEFVNKSGIQYFLRSLKARWIFLFGMGILLLLTLFLPSRILFVKVEGASLTNINAVLDQAEAYGLGFWSKRADIRSEQVKNGLLNALDQLQWVGVNTCGCVATIQLKEKDSEEETENLIHTNIISNCDAVVESIDVTKGTALCKAGQAVQEGQVLISGYEDRGLFVRATGAQGEIIANTFHVVEGLLPLERTVRTKVVDVKTNFSLQIGKKSINFCKDSGISPTGCVKIYSEEYLTLPGGFRLPVAIIKEKCIIYETSAEIVDVQNLHWVADQLQESLLSQMIMGQVVTHSITEEVLQDVYFFTGEYTCREQIGRGKTEESDYQHGKII